MMGCASSKTEVAAPRAATPVVAEQPPKKETQVQNGGKEVTAISGESDTAPAPMLVDFNDIVPGSPSTSRGRFLSYASGASTPNTSCGELSGDEGLVTEEKGGKNSKTLANSGSAIGLEEIQEGAGLTSKVVHIEVPFGKPIEEVYDGVQNGAVLGSGVSGLVRLVTHRATGVQYAVKCLDLGLVGTKEGLAQLREEIFIMCQLDHPNIVRLEEVYESHSEIYLVLELCLGGELFDRLDEQPDYHYTEVECARLVKQMLSAVRYLHSKGIIHRDLKLENFLFSSKAADSELKMIDFGLSKHFQYGEVQTQTVGTPYTVAPEVIQGSYDERCDIWAIGVISFLLLSGDPPFGGCGGPEPLLTVRANILSGKFSFEPEDIWCLVSDHAKEFVKSLLVTDPQSRPLARQAQKHAWLREWASRQSSKNDTILNPNVVKALVNFKEFSDMRKLLSEVLSFTLLPDQIKDLRKEFEKIDTEGSGEISLAALKQVLMTNAGAGYLGALTEEEVEDVFDAMRVSKSETKIHWHEFIAAGLSQCQVDDRNLRLAFDRLDSDHKGYITLDDIMNLVGNNELHNEEHVRRMWKDSMKSVNCTQAQISYENFVLLMKGQTKEPEAVPMVPLVPTTSVGSSKLLVVPEGGQVEDLIGEKESQKEAYSPKLSSHFDADRTSEDEVSIHSLPNMGVVSGMDESNGSEIGQLSPLRSQESPPVVRIISGIPYSEQTKAPDLNPLSKQSISTRPRSKSLADENKNVESDDEASPEVKSSFGGDSRQARLLPEQDHKVDDELAKNKSALAVNRQLFRAHRQMRLSVMEASRRFEEQRFCRARDTLTAQKEKEAGMGIGQAGLVMRHGHKVQVTTDAIRKFLEDALAKQQALLEKANRRGGRGRASRKKTISDMSAMMNPSLDKEEFGTIPARATKTPDLSRTMKRPSIVDGNLDMLAMPSLNIAQANLSPEMVSVAKLGKSEPNIGAEGLSPSVAVVDKEAFRKATVPGHFRKTHDPFSADGMYGAARINQIDVQSISKKNSVNKIDTS